MPFDAALDPLEAARAAGLVYVSDADPGIARRRFGLASGLGLPEVAGVADALPDGVEALLGFLERQGVQA